MFHRRLEENVQTQHAKVDWRIGEAFVPLPFKSGITQQETALLGEFWGEGAATVDYYGFVTNVGAFLEIGGVFALVEGLLALPLRLGRQSE